MNKNNPMMHLVHRNIHGLEEIDFDHFSGRHHRNRKGPRHLFRSHSTADMLLTLCGPRSRYARLAGCVVREEYVEHDLEHFLAKILVQLTCARSCSKSREELLRLRRDAVFRFYEPRETALPTPAFAAGRCAR